jgi:hypothetical protein
MGKTSNAGVGIYFRDFNQRPTWLKGGREISHMPC